jgi:putative selenate reductase
MDTARAALKNSGVEKVSLVYRRTKRYMPADEEELYEAIEDGVEFRELTNPISYKDGILTCAVMQLGSMDESGRASVTETDERVEIPVDTVIIAVGERCDKDWYDANAINTDAKGRPLVDENLQSSIPGVYIVGDGLYGPSIIVKAEANARKAADAILGKAEGDRREAEADICAEDLYAKKGILTEAGEKMNDNARCLHCNVICENCVDVCPNRANIEVKVPGWDIPQIVHVDYMCNECGNCATFCPYASKPYKEKFTLFANEADMADSTNDGFVVLDITKKKYKVRFLGAESVITADSPGSVPGGIVELMNAVMYGHWYMLLRK